MNKIKKIYWVRANLYVETSNEIFEHVFLINENNEKLELEIEDNKIIIPITNLPETQSIEEGKWHILINNEKLKIEDIIIDELDNYSRIFKYRNNFYALLIDFEIDEEMNLYINSNYMMKNKKYKKLNRICEGNKIKKKFKIFLKLIIIFLLNLLNKTIRLLKFSKKTNVLFLSENDTDLKGNLNFLYDKIKEEPYVKISKCLYNKYEKKSLTNMLKAIIFISYADIIIVDNYVSLLNIINISKKQKIVQLWHAGVGFKAVGYARFGKKGGPHPFKSGHRKYTHVIVDDKKLIPIYQEVFGVKKEIFYPSGMPRLEGYLSKVTIENITKKLYEENKLLKEKKVILFCPTYRGETADKAYYDYDKLDLKKMFDFCKKNNYIFLIKMHPFIKEKIEIPKEYKNIIYEYSNYDINELIYISDIMITDYSSCAYEFSFFNRPLIFYRYDKYLYEYLRPLHTLNIFTKEQYEVNNFNDLLKILDELKEIKIKDRFNNIDKHNNVNCDIIVEKIIR